MKLGVTMEGGASRTIFSCGVTDALLEENIMPDYFIGVSAGIAFGVSYLSGQKGRNLELAKNFMGDKRYMGARHLLTGRTAATITFPSYSRRFHTSFCPLIMTLLSGSLGR